MWSGVAVVAAPEVESMHGVDHSQYTLWVLAVPMLLSTFIEAPIALWSDRVPRPRLLAAGLGALAISLGLAALAPSAWLLGVALALAGAASGVACGTAQAELVTRFPGGPHRAMNRWIAYSAAGDAITPLVIAAAYWAGGTHKSALWAAAALLGVHAIAAWRAAPDSEGAAGPLEDDEPVVPLRAALGSAVRQPKLWLFLFGASACTLLDEVVVALAALRLDGDLGWPEGYVAAALTGGSIGGVISASASDRILQRWSPRALLTAATLGSIGTLALFIAAPTAPLASLALFLLGMTSALHYPLVKAAAYELVPGQPGVVNALTSAFVGVEVALPWLIGAIADSYGLAIALAALAAEPIMLLAVAAAWVKRTEHPP